MESLIIAAQDKALNMCYHQRKVMKWSIDSNAESAVRWKNTQSILLWDVQNLHCLNTLIDTVRWLVTSTGLYVHMGLGVSEKYCECISE